MIEFEQFGREILKKPGLDPKERSFVKAHLELLKQELAILRDGRMALESGEKVGQPKNLLQQVIKEYEKGALTPELVTAFWRTKLQADTARVGLNIEVPECDWTAEEIRKPMVDIKGKAVPGIMVPSLKEMALPILGKMYPKMDSYSVRDDTTVKDTHDISGWVKVEALVDAPNRNINLSDAEKFAEKQGYFGQREVTYILASQASKVLTGKYFDEGITRTWLLGSRFEGRVIRAYFYPDGFLYVGWRWYPEVSYPNIGWRFEEVKRT